MVCVDGAIILLTNKKIPFSDASFNRFLIINKNCVAVKLFGTKYFLLSNISKPDPGFFSHITGTLSGYLFFILCDSSNLS